MLVNTFTQSLVTSRTNNYINCNNQVIVMLYMYLYERYLIAVP